MTRGEEQRAAADHMGRVFWRLIEAERERQKVAGKPAAIQAPKLEELANARAEAKEWGVLA